MSKSKPDSDKAGRLSEALRANLKRRKQAARKARADPDETLEKKGR